MPAKTSKPVRRHQPATAPGGMAISSLFLNAKWSDITIVCGDKKFSAHRCVVCRQSTYFSLACDGNFKESSGKIEMNDAEPILVEKTLQFLYTGDYTIKRDMLNSMEMFGQPSTPGSPASQSVCPNLGEQTATRFHVRMYAQGTYFQIDALKAKAKEHFARAFLEDPDTWAIAATVDEVYKSTLVSDQGLRDVVTEKIMKFLPLLPVGPKPSVGDYIFKLVPEFTVDLCRASLARNVELEQMEKK
ncbi:hypothetical protein ASPCADRAFT_399142 [Aspergillus carbonarius ITEM 5010]|uniref:BTB domain-containing protein n=1 Tax=Aspergillus carbonarius (strain ITEM 5010) TaxID=602072 RepID=A0A1R3REH0_ASPC5|nr:hypothetical protein ASPCADRAFT_399142 [Aspergillus carbonarius ITEM 5010]